MSICLRAGLKAAAVAALLATGTAAHAATDVTEDQTGDVVRISGGHGHQGVDPQVVRHHRVGDVIVMETTTSATELRVTVSFDRLPRNRFFTWDFSTGTGDRYTFLERRTPAATGSPGTREFTQGGAAVPCPGLVETVTRLPRDGLPPRVELVVPRSCFGAAESIRVGFESTNTNAPLGTMFTDDRRKGRTGLNPRLGPALPFQ